MSKFKVGDRVRVIDAVGGGKLGDIATVKRVDGDFYLLDGLSSEARGLFGKRLELAPVALKVGDRVRFTGAGGWGHKVLKGLTGIIHSTGTYDFEWTIFLDAPNDFAHTCDGVFSGHFGRWADSDELELEPRTVREFKVGDRVRIVAHANYRGDKIKKDLPIGSVHTVERITRQIADVNCYVLSGGGLYFYTAKDLEPALKIEAGKFYKTRDGRKVGPAKNYVYGINDWSIGQVFLYQVDGTYRGANRQLDIIAEWPADAIVCLIRNGQPIPATKPFVHPSREAATTEAERLACTNLGQEFGVYELVTTRKEEKPAPVYAHEWQRLAAEGQTYEAKTELMNDAGIEFYQAAQIVNCWLPA